MIVRWRPAWAHTAVTLPSSSTPTFGSATSSLVLEIVCTRPRRPSGRRIRARTELANPERPSRRRKRSEVTFQTKACDPWRLPAAATFAARASVTSACGAVHAACAAGVAAALSTAIASAGTMRRRAAMSQRETCRAP